MKQGIGMMLIAAALAVGVAGGTGGFPGALTLPIAVVLAVAGIGMVEEPRINGRWQA